MMVEASGPGNGRNACPQTVQRCSAGLRSRTSSTTGSGGTVAAAVPRTAGLLLRAYGGWDGGSLALLRRVAFSLFVPYRRWVRSRIVA